MLLWEIAESKIPYHNITNIAKIKDLVAIQNIREKFSNEDVPKEWKKLVEKGNLK